MDVLRQLNIGCPCFFGALPWNRDLVVASFIVRASAHRSVQLGHSGAYHKPALVGEVGGSDIGAAALRTCRT